MKKVCYFAIACVTSCMHMYGNSQLVRQFSQDLVTLKRALPEEQIGRIELFEHIVGMPEKYPYENKDLQQYEPLVSIPHLVADKYFRTLFKNQSKTSPKKIVDVAGQAIIAIVDKDGNEWQSGDAYLQTPKGRFAVGSFEIRSVEFLRKEWAKKAHPGDGRLNIIEGQYTEKRASSKFRKYVDIGAMQANIVNREAAFQVASNFNCLESRDEPENGIINYVGGPAQGEEASLSAMPAAIYRMYFVPHAGVYGQFQKSINLLRNVKIPDVLGSFFAITNGKILISYDNTYFNKPGDPRGLIDRGLGVKILPMANKPLFLKENSKKEWDSSKALMSVQLGIHKNVQVTAGFSMPRPENISDSEWNSKGLGIRSWTGSSLAVNDPNQIITQIFTSAQNLKRLGRGTAWDDFAKMLLDAAYEGTVYAADLAGCKKLYLTLMGTGVFENDMSWVVNSIVKVKELIIQSGMDVTLVVFDGKKDPEWDANKERILDVVKESDGTYTIYNDQYPDGQIQQL